MHIPDHWKPTFDFASIGALVGTFIELVPKATAVLTLVWMCIRIYETDTVQKILKKAKRPKGD